jgi:hypothetical protein
MAIDSCASANSSSSASQTPQLLAATHDERVADIHREHDVESLGGTGRKV